MATKKSLILEPNMHIFNISKVYLFFNEEFQMIEIFKTWQYGSIILCTVRKY